MKSLNLKAMTWFQAKTSVTVAKAEEYDLPFTMDTW